MNIFVLIGLVIIYTVVVGCAGSYMGRYAILKDFGMNWDDYRKKLGGRRPH